MACDAGQVLVNGSQFLGLSTPQLKAVQLQLVADSLLALAPASDVTLEAVLSRACASGISCLTKNQLRAVILELLCQIKEAA